MEEYRAIFADAGHPRLATAFSQMMLGYFLYLDFVQDYGQIDQQKKVEMKDRARTVFLEMCDSQSEKVDGEKPTRLFVELLKEMLETKQVRLCDARPRTAEGITTENEISTPNTVGYEDDSYIYLIPNAAYNAVTAFYAKSGYTFPSSPAALWKMFNQEGKTRCDKGRNDSRKQIRGKTGRYITLHSHVLNEGSSNE